MKPNRFRLLLPRLLVCLVGLGTLLSNTCFAETKPIWFSSRHGSVTSIKVARAKSSGTFIQLQFTDTLSGPGFCLVAGKFPQTAWLMLDSAGKVSKAWHYPSEGEQQPGDVAVGSDGSMVSVGAYLAELPWNLPKGSLPGHGALDAWLMRVHKNGEFDWAMSAGGFNNDVGLATWVNDKGSLWLAGMGNSLAFDNQQILAGQTGALVASFSSKAQLRWARGFPASVFSAFHDVWVDSLDRTLAVGQVMGDWVVGSDTLLGGTFTQPCLVALNHEGNVIQYKRMACSGDAVFEMVAGAGNAGYASAGQFQGNLMVGSDTLMGEEGSFRPVVCWLDSNFMSYGVSYGFSAVPTQGTPAICRSKAGGIWLAFVQHTDSNGAAAHTVRIQHYGGPKKTGPLSKIMLPNLTRVCGLQETDAGTLLVWGESLAGSTDSRKCAWLEEIPLPGH